MQKENSHHELPRAANGSRPPFRLQGCFLTRRQAQDFHKKATPTVSLRKEVQHREALRHGHCHAEGFARRPAGFDGSAAVPEGPKKTHGRCGRGNRAAARRPLADVDSSRWVAEGLTDKEIAKRTPKQSTLPVPPVIPPGEPRGGLLFPLTYELISTKYLLCVPNTTRLPLRSSKS